MLETGFAILSYTFIACILSFDANGFSVVKKGLMSRTAKISEEEYR